VQPPAAWGEHVTGALTEVAAFFAVPTKLSTISPAAWDGMASKPLVAEALPPSPETVTWQLRWCVSSAGATRWLAVVAAVIGAVSLSHPKVTVSAAVVVTFGQQVSVLPTAGVPLSEGRGFNGAGVVKTASAPSALATPLAAAIRKWYVVAALRPPSRATTARLPPTACGTTVHGTPAPYAVVIP
jgi:hypothetical protein